MSEILLLEDHEGLRRSMAQALHQLDNVHVDAVGTLGAAVASLAINKPDLIISDLDLPDGSGIELIGHLGRPPAVPVVFVSGHIPRYQTMLRACPGVTVRHKPLGLQELQDLARDKLGSPLDDSPFGPADYIQLACMGRHSVQIIVSEGATRGSIIVQQGALRSAQIGLLRGLPALARMAFSAGHTRCVTLREPGAARNLPEQQWEQVLLEAARLKDENDRLGVKARIDGRDLAAFFEDADEPGSAAPADLADPRFDPAPASVEAPPEAPPEPASDTSADDDEFEALVERGTDALLQKDYFRALRQYEEAKRLRPNDTLVLANLERLAEIMRRAESQ